MSTSPSTSPDTPQPSGNATFDGTPLGVLRGAISESNVGRPSSAERTVPQRRATATPPARRTKRSISDTQPPQLRKLLEGDNYRSFQYHQKSFVRSIGELTDLPPMMNRTNSLSDFVRKQATWDASLASFDAQLHLEIIHQLGDGDWRGLAMAYGLDNDTIESLEANKDRQPAAALLQRMMDANMAVDDFVSYLERIGRFDLVGLVTGSHAGGVNGHEGAWSRSHTDTDLSSVVVPRSFSRMVDDWKTTSLRITLTPPGSPTLSRRSYPAASSQRKHPIGTNSLPRSSSPITRPSRNFSVDCSSATRNFSRRSRLSDLSSSASYSDDVAKLALVVGNGDYVVKSLRLSTPVEDARAVASLLKGLGWTVKCCVNTDSSTLKKDLAAFVSQCLDEFYATVVVFYAGHAVQIGNENFILPVDVKSLKTAAYVRHCAGNITQTLAPLTSCMSLVGVLNACHSVPGWPGLSGLCTPNYGRRACILYSSPLSSGDQEASPNDSESKCSKFTENLVKTIEKSPDGNLRSLVRSMEDLNSSPLCFCHSQPIFDQFSFSTLFSDTPTFELTSKHALLIQNSAGYASRAEANDAAEDMSNLSSFLVEKQWKVMSICDVSSAELLESVNEFLLKPDVQADDSVVMVLCTGRVHQSSDQMASVLGVDATNSSPGVPVDVLSAMVEEHLAGPKILLIGGVWNVDSSNVSTSSEFPISQNMLVSYFTENPESPSRYIARLTEKWSDWNGSYFNLFNTMQPAAIWHCLFTC
eukprot:m.249092 g.249092  ORF g.249092 m.249092 type:complete len:756 (+) comp40299_c0_seq40:959-3226(+)